jgi:hypothetical protein
MDRIGLIILWLSQEILMLTVRARILELFIRKIMRDISENVNGSSMFAINSLDPSIGNTLGSAE